MTSKPKSLIVYTTFIVALCFGTVLADSPLDLSKAIDSGQLRRGHHWTPDEANLKMKEYASKWQDRKSWEKRAKAIREGVLKGLFWEKMPEIVGDFDPIIHSRRKMKGYYVENIAIKSFPGSTLREIFIRRRILQNGIQPFYRRMDMRQQAAHRRRAEALAAFARMGAIAFAYDMVGYAESTQTTHKMPIAALLQTWNSTRVLEYLLSRPDVDADRIGMTGGSGAVPRPLSLLQSMTASKYRLL